MAQKIDEGSSMGGCTIPFIALLIGIACLVVIIASDSDTADRVASGIGALAFGVFFWGTIANIAEN